MKNKLILIAEDEEADIGLMEVVLGECGILDQVAFARDGEKALDYLHCGGETPCSTDFVPALIILDLKLPKVTGLEVLKRLRNNERLREVPVVVFSSSLDEREKAECLAYGANNFVVKPLEFDAFSNALMQVIRKYVN
jgi:two-component system, response regulator